MTTTPRSLVSLGTSTGGQTGDVPTVCTEDFLLVRPAVVTRARALLEGHRWDDDDVVAAVAAELLFEGGV